MPVLKPVQAVTFDPKNPQHRASYATYLKTKTLRPQFELEHPYTDVLTMVQAKLAKYAVES